MTNTTQHRTGRSPLLTRLDALHAEYVERINRTQSDPSLTEQTRDVEVTRLTAAYDGEAVRLVAEHEGRTDLLPLRTQKGVQYGDTASGMRRLGRMSWLTRFDPFGHQKHRHAS